MTSEPQRSPSLRDGTPPIIHHPSQPPLLASSQPPAPQHPPLHPPLQPPPHLSPPVLSPPILSPPIAPPLTHPQIAYWVWLALPTVILLLAWLMSTGTERQVSLPGLGVLPETCTLHARFGIDCPGCGLTRSFIHLAHGEVPAAWELNPVGLFLFAFVLLQIPLAIGHLLNKRRLSWLQRIVRRATPWNHIILIGLLVALLIQWLVRIGFVS